MNRLLITLLLLFGAAVQTLLPPWAFLGSLEWPVLTGVLITISLHTDRSRLIYASLLTGLLYDVFSPAPLGTAMPFFLLLGAGLFALRDEVFSDQIVSYIVLGLLALLLKTIYFTLILSISGLRPFTPKLLPVRLGGSILLGALTVPLVYLTAVAFRHAVPASGRRKW
jgi:rod shape-determining protein MreD